MFKHYLITALRNLKRSKLSASIGILGLAMGIACFMAAIGTIAFLTGSDRHLPNADRLAVVSSRTIVEQLKFDTGFQPSASWVVRDHLRADFPHLKTARANNVRELPVSANGR